MYLLKETFLEEKLFEFKLFTEIFILKILIKQC